MRFFVLMLLCNFSYAADVNKISSQFNDAFNQQKWDKVVSFYHPADLKSLVSQTMSDFEALDPETAARYVKTLDADMSLEQFRSLEPKKIMILVSTSWFSRAKSTGLNISWSERKLIGPIVEGKVAYYIGLTDLNIDGSIVKVKETISFTRRGGSWYLEVPYEYEWHKAQKELFSKERAKMEKELESAPKLLRMSDGLKEFEQELKSR